VVFEKVLGPVIFCGLESSRKAPVGFALTVKGFTPFPIKTPVKVVAPLPPPSTGNVL
jgi:hypothetical protein